MDTLLQVLFLAKLAIAKTLQRHPFWDYFIPGTIKLPIYLAPFKTHWPIHTSGLLEGDKRFVKKKSFLNKTGSGKQNASFDSL